MDEAEILLKLSGAVSFFYKTDAISPGVVISTLKNGMIYCSVVRYNTVWEHGKKVCCSATAMSLKEALILASKRFVAHTQEQTPVKVNPLDELKNLVTR